MDWGTKRIAVTNHLLMVALMVMRMELENESDNKTHNCD